MSNIHTNEPGELGKIMLQAGIVLLKAGANSKRIIVNLNRFSSSYGYLSDVELNTRNISITLQKDDQHNIFSGTRSMNSQPGADFTIIAAVSHLSWQVAEKKMHITEVGNELNKVTNSVKYHRAVVIFLVGLAGASFCYTFGGNFVEMATTFVATASGLLFKQEMLARKFNPYLITYCSAFIAALIIGIIWKLSINLKLDHAFATCTLFLIPGVPLINSFIDLIDGYILNGIDRGINASIHAFGIAAGLATVLYIFNF